MRIIPIILLILSLTQCKHYFVRDATKYNLTQEEETLLKSKKIGVIGFHPFYRHVIQYCCDNYNPQLISNKLLRVLQFVYEKKDSEELEFDPNYFIKGQGKNRIEFRLSSQDTAKEYLKFAARLNNKNKTQPDTKIPENNLRLFLKVYLDQIQHLGYKEVMDVIDFSDKNKIYLKKNDFDYWVIGFHSPTTSNSGAKTFLSIFPFIFTLGIFPFWDDVEVHSNIWILDKNLFLIKKLEFENEYTFFTASWVFWQNRTRDAGTDPTYIYEPDLKEFSKELAKIVRDAK